MQVYKARKPSSTLARKSDAQPRPATPPFERRSGVALRAHSPSTTAKPAFSNPARFLRKLKSAERVSLPESVSRHLRLPVRARGFAG